MFQKPVFQEGAERLLDIDAETEDWALKMRRARGGDQAAYRQLLREIALYAKTIARAFFSSTYYGDMSVDDIAQETLLAVHLRQDRWDPQRKLRPWVAGIIIHKSIDELRRIRIRPTVPFIETEMCGVDPFKERQAIWVIARLVESLAPRQRDIVVSISLQGHSVSATAARLSMSEGAVRIALHRSIKKMAAVAGDGIYD